MRTAGFVFAVCGIALLPIAVDAQGADGGFGPRDAADAIESKAGDLHGTPDERAVRIHDQQTEDRLQQVEKNQGEEARLKAEQEYERTHTAK
jgi:hypothetical protein